MTEHLRSLLERAAHEAPRLDVRAPDLWETGRARRRAQGGGWLRAGAAAAAVAAVTTGVLVLAPDLGDPHRDGPAAGSGTSGPVLGPDRPGTLPQPATITWGHDSAPPEDGGTGIRLTALTTDDRGVVGVLGNGHATRPALPGPDHPGAPDAVLSPDGATVGHAWRDGDRIGVGLLDVTTGGVRTLDLTGAGLVDLRHLLFSPDSRRVGFVGTARGVLVTGSARLDALDDPQVVAGGDPDWASGAAALDDEGVVHVAVRDVLHSRHSEVDTATALPEGLTFGSAALNVDGVLALGTSATSPRPGVLTVDLRTATPPPRLSGWGDTPRGVAVDVLGWSDTKALVAGTLAGADGPYRVDQRDSSGALHPVTRISGAPTHRVSLATRREPMTLPPTALPVWWAPDGTGTGPLDLSTVTGPALVYVTGAWCTPCRRQTGRLDAFAEEHPEVRVVALHLQDTRATARAMARSEGPHHLHARVTAEDLARSPLTSRIAGIPFLVGVAPDGTVRTASGEPTDDELAALLGRD